jgi:hypothetical protein
MSLYSMSIPGSEGLSENHRILIKYDVKLPSKLLHKGLLLLHGLVADVGNGAFGELLMGGSRVVPNISFSANEIGRNTCCNSRHVIIHFTKDVQCNVVSNTQYECISSPRVTLNFHDIRRWEWAYNTHTNVPVISPLLRSHHMYSNNEFLLVASIVFRSIQITIDNSKCALNTTVPFCSLAGIEACFLVCQRGLDGWIVVIVPHIVWPSIW